MLHCHLLREFSSICILLSVQFGLTWFSNPLNNPLWGQKPTLWIHSCFIKQMRMNCFLQLLVKLEGLFIFRVQVVIYSINLTEHGRIGPLLCFRKQFLTEVCCGLFGGGPAFMKENADLVQNSVFTLHHNEKREENDGLPCYRSFIALSQIQLFEPWETKRWMRRCLQTYNHRFDTHSGHLILVGGFLQQISFQPETLVHGPDLSETSQVCRLLQKPPRLTAFLWQQIHGMLKFEPKLYKEAESLQMLELKQTSALLGPLSLTP